MAFPFIMDRAMRCRHCSMCVCPNVNEQFMESKSANMQVKTPQSQPVEIKRIPVRTNAKPWQALPLCSCIHVRLTIFLLWCTPCTSDKPPLVCLWQWLFLFVLVLKQTPNSASHRHPWKGKIECAFLEWRPPHRPNACDPGLWEWKPCQGWKYPCLEYQQLNEVSNGK